MDGPLDSPPNLDWGGQDLTGTRKPQNVSGTNTNTFSDTHKAPRTITKTHYIVMRYWLWPDIAIFELPEYLSL
eukprot:3469447-Karenia_brevis.AAC.1